jgi:hypothetical protein
MRSPRESIAADIAATLSSSIPLGKLDARARPSGDTSAAPCTSLVLVTRFCKIPSNLATLIPIFFLLIYFELLCELFFELLIDLDNVE